MGIAQRQSGKCRKNPEKFCEAFGVNSTSPDRFSGKG